MSLNAALNAGRTSLQTSQKAIEVTGLNIANVNTPGYSRQTPVLSPYPALLMGEFFVGQGVTVTGIERSHDVFLAGQIQSKNAEVGYESVMESPLEGVERAVSLGDGSIADEFDNFFNSLRELSANPSGEVERRLVIQQGGLVAAAFQDSDKELDLVQGNINTTMTSMIDGVNIRAAEIAELNNRITAVEASGQDAAADRDRRDLLSKELAKSIGAIGFETSNGSLSVQLPNGMPLVEADIATPLQGQTVDGDLQLYLQFGDTDIDLDQNSFGGEFGGLLQVRDVLIPQVRDRLDQLAYDFTVEVNAQHQAGVGLDGVSGRDFFTPLATVANAASSMIVGITDTAQLGVGGATGTGAPGDNENLLLMLDLEQAQTIGTDTFVSYYAKTTAIVGVEAARNRQAVDGLEDALVQLENLRDGVDGVSLEEEMINLLKYQNAFDASAKFLGTIDEMMDSLLTL